MKVLHLITRLVGGGAEKNTLDTVRGLHSKGYDVHLMYGGQSDAMEVARDPLPSGVKVIVIPELVREISPLKDFMAYRKIRRIIAEEGYDIVHTHLAKAGIIGRIAARSAGVRHIIHGIHGISFPDTINPIKRAVYRGVERYCGGFTDRFISVGDDIRMKYIEAGVGKENSYCVIRSGIDHEKFDSAERMTDEDRARLKASLGIDSNELVVGMVSKLEKRKGYKYFIESAAELSSENNNIKFLIVGDGRELQNLMAMVRSRRIKKNVIFAGYRFDVAQVISIFDVAVLTSLWEGLPQFLVQSALLSKPVVAFAVDGAREVVRDGISGFIVQVKDVKALKEKIKLLLEDGDLRQKMGNEAGCLIDRTCTVDNMVMKTHELYTSLLKAN